MSAPAAADPAVEPVPPPEASDAESSPASGYVPNPLEVYLFPDDAAGWAVRVTPGSATAGVLALLDPAGLSQGGRVDALLALDRLAGWAVALQHRVIAAMSDDPYRGSPAPKLERFWGPPASEGVAGGGGCRRM